MAFIEGAIEELGGDTGTETAPRLVSHVLDPIKIREFRLASFGADEEVIKNELVRLIGQLETAEESGAATGDAQLTAYYEAKDSFARRSELQREYAVLTIVLNVVEARNRVQCARYDGALRGTSVGMNLFYTDVLAKLWAGLDFGAQAPVMEVPGFRHLPGTTAKLDAIYEDEQRRLPGTRLWFGHKPSSLRHDGEGKLLFQPIATRVYAAGNNPLQPGQESEASEASLRVFTWWDRHFQEVADYEPAYHRQNQIMKWSIVTGILADEGLLSWLDGETVDTSQRFDLWYPTQADLKFRDNIHILPPAKWIGVKNTECMEISRILQIPRPPGRSGRLFWRRLPWFEACGDPGKPARVRHAAQSRRCHARCRGSGPVHLVRRRANRRVDTRRRFGPHRAVAEGRKRAALRWYRERAEPALSRRLAARRGRVVGRNDGERSARRGLARPPADRRDRDPRGRCRQRAARTGLGATHRATYRPPRRTFPPAGPGGLRHRHRAPTGVPALRWRSDHRIPRWSNAHLSAGSQQRPARTACVPD
jgi:hypothetical protein